MASPDNSIKNNGAHITKFKTDLTNQEIAQLSVINGTYYNPQSVSSAIDFSLRQQNTKMKNQRQAAATLGASLLNAGVTIKNTSDLMINGLTNPEKFGKKKENLVDQLSYGSRPKPRAKDNPYTKMKSTKERIVGISDLNYTGTMFPPDLAKNAPSYIELQFYSYYRPNPMAEGTTEPGVKIQFPMPQNFTQNYSIRLDQKDTGFYGDIVNQTQNAGVGLANALKTGKMPSGEEFINNTGDLLKNAGLRGMMMGVDVLDTVGISGLAGADSGSASGILTQFMGAVPNPHASVFFKGMDLRQWSWVWKFVPRSESESNTIKKILDLIKRLVLPQTDGSLLKYPYMIQPKIIGDEKGVMGTFNMTMVKNLMINFTPEGGSAFFVDGAPVAIELTMEFQEITIQTGGEQGGGSGTQSESTDQSSGDGGNTTGSDAGAP